MAAKRKSPPTRSTGIESLFHRVVAILDQARESVVRSVNSHMVLAYWYIGREIVQTLQGGDERAEYGRRLVYADRRAEILHKPGGESAAAGKLHKACGIQRERRLLAMRRAPAGEAGKNR